MKKEIRKIIYNEFFSQNGSKNAQMATQRITAMMCQYLRKERMAVDEHATGPAIYRKMFQKGHNAALSRVYSEVMK